MRRTRSAVLPPSVTKHTVLIPMISFQVESKWSYEVEGRCSGLDLEMMNTYRIEAWGHRSGPKLSVHSRFPSRWTKAGWMEFRGYQSSLIEKNRGGSQGQHLSRLVPVVYGCKDRSLWLIKNVCGALLRQFLGADTSCLDLFSLTAYVGE